MLVEIDIDNENHLPVESKPYTLPLKHCEWVWKEMDILEKG